MMRPIDADMAIDAIQKDREISWKDLENDDAEYRNGCDDGYAYSMQIISELPSADAIEVIRCENCKHYKKSEVSDRMMCWRKDVDGQPVCYDFNPNDFCSYGKRRTDG